MKKKLPAFLEYIILLCWLLFLFTKAANAQLTNFQQTTTKCYTGPTASMDNTTGTLVGNVGFTSADIPPGYKIVDVIVEIVWSKTDDGSCTSITGVPADVSDVGFVIQAPFGPVRYLAASNLIGPYVGTSSSFIGLSNTIRDTIVFQDGANSMLPAGLPVAGRDTVHPNNDPLHFYCGNNPHGSWSIGGIDDAPSSGPKLCIHSYCITIVSCDATQLKASCKVNPSLGVGATGVHTFEFADLDSISDVSCLVENISFSPTTISCSDIGHSIPVTMTIRDHLDSVASCVSLVSIVDSTPPVIAQCSPNVLGTLYLDTAGRDSLWANSILASDNCGVLTKQVRPLSGGLWSSFVPIHCLLGLQQFDAQVIDSSGNISSCNITINIIDTIRPTALCGQDTAYLSNNPNGAVSVSPTNVDGGSFDRCPPISDRWIGSRFAPDPIYTCADLGVDTVRLIVADASGNLDSCDNAIITIIDRIKPIVICKNDTVYLNSSGIANVSASDIDQNSSDNCSIDRMNINGLSSITFNCFHVNNNQQATLTVFDPSGNVDSCTASISVLDTFPPVANCRNLSIYLNAGGTAIIEADSLNNGSVDFCTGTHLSFEIGGNPRTTLDCSNLNTNPNPIILTVADSFGNHSTCTAFVRVMDTIAPLASCRNTAVYLNSSGFASVYAADLSAGGSDNCGIIDSFVNISGNPFIRFNCFSLFTPQSARLIVEDAEGNTATCLAAVSVLDSIRPLALCKASITAQLDATGVRTVFPTAIDSNSTDNCALIVEYLINNARSAVYTCADIGTQTASLSVRDSSGNTATCLTQIVIQDTIAPTATCQTTNVYLGTGSTTITPSDVITSSTADNCTTFSSTFVGQGNNIVYTCDSLGTRSVVVLVSDASGNTATCTSSINVLDTIPPVASCLTAPYTVQLDATGNGFVVPQNIDNGSSDFCGISNSLVNGLDSVFYSCADVGNTSVTLLVLDASGNLDSCIANVTVNDSINPIALCRDTILYLNGAGFTTITPNLINAGSSDNCSFTSTVNGFSSINFNCNQLGMNTVQLILIDNSGNARQCAANITLWDTVAPVANCIGAGTLTLYLDNSCVASVAATTINNGSTDNCNGPLMYRIGGAANRVFNATNLATNPNQLILSVEDIMGNISTCTTTVIVSDTIAPTAICQNDTLYLDSSGVATVFANDINGNSMGACGIDSVNINGLSSLNFNCSHVNNNQPITLTVFDASGNSDSCMAWVKVLDTFPPVANCRNLSVYLDAAGTASVPANRLDNGSIDLCTGTNLGFEIGGNPTTNFNCSHLSSNPNRTILTLIDSFGNKNTCTASINVLDTIPPLVSCRNVNAYLDALGVATVYAADLSAGSFDNCGVRDSFVNILGNAFSTFNCTNLFTPQSATLIVEDAQGNTASCLATINVMDSIRPLAFCKTAIVAQLDAIGIATVLPTAIDSNSIDNCALVEYLINNSNSVSYTCADLGTQSASLSLRDSSGNTASCLATINVMDSIRPLAFCKTAIVAQLDATGIATVLPTAIDSNSIDNCALVEYLINNSNSVSYTCADLGTQSASLSLRDSSGNTASCQAQIKIQDTIAPTAICQNDTLYFAGATIPVQATSLDGGSFDNCTLQSFVLSQDTFDCLDIGMNTLSLSVTDSEGNSGTCIANIMIIDTTASAAAGSTQLLCARDSTTLNASIPLSPLMGTWTSHSGATISNPNAANTLITNIPIGSNIFYWTLSNGTCSNLSTDSVLIEVISGSSDIAHAGEDQSLCQDSTAILSASSLTTSTGTWKQSVAQSNAGVVIANPSDSTSMISGLIAGNAYTFVWELANGSCGLYSSDTVIITIDNIPNDQADAGQDVLCSPDTINLDASFSIMGSQGLWSTPSTAFIEDSSSANSMASNFEQDTSLMIWSLSNGVCVDYSSDTMTIILGDVLPLSNMDHFNLIPDGSILTVDVILNDVLPPSWNIFIQSSMIDGQMTNLHNGKFELDLNNVTSEQSFVYEICNGTCPNMCDTAWVRIDIQHSEDCYIPTAFTPNNDGQNDFFVIPCLQNTNKKAGITIFNRWGSLVFKREEYHSDWDGTHQNQPLPDGVYFYILQIEGKTPQNGSIEIKR